MYRGPLAGDIDILVCFSWVSKENIRVLTLTSCRLLTWRLKSFTQSDRDTAAAKRVPPLGLE